jgi:hypothetical protein
MNNLLLRFRLKLGLLLIKIGDKISYEVWEDDESYVEPYEKKVDKLHSNLTSDKLFNKIDEIEKFYHFLCDYNYEECLDFHKLIESLRSIIQLHKPKLYSSGAYFCDHCTDTFPCDTIYTIDEVLK